MAISTTNFNNANTNGLVVADGFVGAPSQADISAQRNSTQAAVFPNGQTTSGPYMETLVTVAAAGATQGNATQIPANATLVNVTVTASTEGVKLPTVAAGLTITMLTPTNKGYKIYSAAAGQVINSASTATTAFAIATNKPTTFYGVDSTHWRALKSG